MDIDFTELDKIQDRIEKDHKDTNGLVTFSILLEWREEVARLASFNNTKEDKIITIFKEHLEQKNEE